MGVERIRPYADFFLKKRIPPLRIVHAGAWIPPLRPPPRVAAVVRSYGPTVSAPGLRFLGCIAIEYVHTRSRLFNEFE